MGRNFTPEVLQALDAPFRNGLAPRGGLAFDGTVNCRAAATLTGQVVGTDDVSLSVVFRVPTTNTEMWAVAVGPSTGDLVGTTGGMGIFISAAGHLQAGVQATAGYEYRRISNFVTAYAGKVVHVVSVRSGATMAIYVNGAVQATIAGDTSAIGALAYSITSTILAVNFRGTAYSTGFAGTIYSASLYNLALAPADVLEIYEGGGAVPERFKFGSQVAKYTSDFSAGVDSWRFGLSYTTVTGNVDAIGGQNDVLSVDHTPATPSAFVSVTRTSTAELGSIAGKGKRLALIGQVYIPAATSYGSLSLQDGSTNTVYGAITPARDTWGAFRIEVTPESAYPEFRSPSAVTSSNPFYLRALQFVQIGAVVHLDGESDGIGYQWHDQSTNKLDAVLTTTGVSWTKPQRRGYVRGTLTWAGTHETKTLTGAVRDVPSEAVITLVTTKATVATTGAGVSVGSLNTSNRYVATNAITTAKKSHALATTLPASASDGDCSLAVDPTDAAYTGSITAEVHYSVTEGTP